MVTTIKITCDGVFIQSNSYLTREHHHRSSSLPSNTTQQLERSLRQRHQTQPLNGHTYTKSHQTQAKTNVHSESASGTGGSTSPSSDNSIVSCERVGHDKKFTISFLNSRQPVRQTTATTSDINNNSKSCGSVAKINDNNNNNKNSVKSYNNNTKRQLGISLSASPLASNKSSSSTATGFATIAPTKVAQNIG